MDQEPKLILGLCCINNFLNKSYGVRSRTITLKNYTVELAIERAILNLKDVLRLIEENIKNGIKSYRISSDLLPRFTDQQVESYDMDQFDDLFEEIGLRAAENDIRLSFHPDQFVVLSSPNEKIVEQSIREIEYHCKMLQKMGVSRKMGVCNIHVGGVYEPAGIRKKDNYLELRKELKREVFERWTKNYNRLSNAAKDYLTVENDEKSYNLDDCLTLSEMCGVPIVYDTHHEECYVKLHPNEIHIPVEDNLDRIIKSWKDRHPMAHISNQDPNNRVGAHSEYIDRVPEILYTYAKKCPEMKLYVDVEAKGKESAIYAMREKFDNVV